MMYMTPVRCGTSWIIAPVRASYLKTALASAASAVLPSETNQPLKTKPENVNLAVTKDGDVFWNQQPVADADELLEKLKKVSVMEPQPEVHIRGDQQARYEFIGKVIVAAQRAGIAKIGFITEPPARGG